MEAAQAAPVSQSRNRDSVLGLIVPKILAVIHARGHKLHGFGGRSVRLNQTIVLCADRIDAHRLVVSVYAEPAAQVVKVLSLHVTDFPSAMDPDVYRYRGGQVAVLSWRRGEWEDLITAEKLASLPIQEALCQWPLQIESRLR